MIRFDLLLTVLWLGGGIEVPPEQQSDTAEERIQTLLAAEHAFCEACAEKGIGAGFLEVLAPRAVLFRPEPVDARSWMQQNDESGLLSWRPAHAEVAVEGSLGFTTGPYEVRAEAGAPQVGRGTYFSVWQRTDGRWRLRVDGGVGRDDRRQGGSPTRWIRPAESAAELLGEKADADAVEEQLREMERDLSAAETGEESAELQRECLADGVHFLRAEALPRPGWEVASEWLEAHPARRVLKPQSVVASAAGDLACSYGLSELHLESGAVQRTAYARVYRLTTEGEYEVVLDYESPIAPPGKPESSGGAPEPEADD